MVQQQVRLWMPTGVNGEWEYTRITVPEILRDLPLTLKQKQEYLQTLIFTDVLGPAPKLKMFQENQKALMESRYALMIRKQETILQFNKNNPLIIKKQLELLRTLAKQILCEDTLVYLYSVIEKYNEYIEGLEWKTTTTTPTTIKELTQTQKFRMWKDKNKYKAWM